jgi:hypothetical protein
LALISSDDRLPHRAGNFRFERPIAVVDVENFRGFGVPTSSEPPGQYRNANSPPLTSSVFRVPGSCSALQSTAETAVAALASSTSDASCANAAFAVPAVKLKRRDRSERVSHFRRFHRRFLSFDFFPTKRRAFRPPFTLHCLAQHREIGESRGRDKKN